MQAILISEIVSQLRQKRNGRTFIAEFINKCEWVDTIPLDRIKQAKEEIEPYVHEDKYDCINDDMTGWICASEVVAILDKLIESEG